MATSWWLFESQYVVQVDVKILLQFSGAEVTGVYHCAHVGSWSEN